jgi:hypothetical protein
MAVLSAMMTSAGVGLTEIPAASDGVACTMAVGEVAAVVLGVRAAALAARSRIVAPP